jgi:polysaccharide export outer membrane protein
MQALSLAGGLSPYAKEDEIIVLRRKADGSQQVIEVDYPAIKKGSALETNIMLKSGDVIIIP